MSASSRRVSSADRAALEPARDADEERANALIHAGGLALAVLGAAALARIASSPVEVTAAIAFSLPMMAMFAASTLHHGLMGPIKKRVFLAFDHGAVLLLIAGNWTAFALLGLPGPERAWLIGGVWLAAGLALALAALAFLGGRESWFERFSPPYNLAFGWVPLIAFGPAFAAHLPRVALALVIAGGAAYSSGVAFYVRRGRRWTHAAWHVAVIVGCALHFAALLVVLDGAP
jgi:hemolysin III